MLPARDQMRYYQYLINVKTIPKVLLRTQFYHRVQSYLANNGADVWVIHLYHINKLTLKQSGRYCFIYLCNRTITYESVIIFFHKVVNKYTID